ncbi:monovalent cation/H+ antiporter subunit D [Aliidiomarina taiwanensis]|uniref:Monovalent cation/H+ antiporter subunit D n=1 Tax=Aliidiomarina taiwanensis TaxID=946228 RepID=A0A432X8D6_9GAMM|nr:monovalent cation/H+ antiporter subunit D [Aliidiomarina taiwanensis]RUO43647.1 monovalent cation/H+ antiporter subunit D [Aliidiomarina taiwanensis]
MSHLLLTPILLPALTAVLLVFMARSSLKVTRVISLASALVVLAVSLYFVAQSAAGGIEVYALGNWLPPFGIIIIADRLSSLMLLVNAVLVVSSIAFTFSWKAERNDSLQPLIHFLAMGVNGAFLTGDLFNLFVFFEVMLIASYALAIFGGGKERAKAGLHYVILNLVGSSFFIIGLGIVYGLLGTMNMADLAAKVAELPPEHAPLLAAAALVLLLVFGLKSAILPLYFWLPRAYAAAIAPVAALFAIMTKVGVYSIVRVHGMIFNQAPIADLLAPWLWPIAILTIAAGSIGVLGVKRVRSQIAYTVVISVGTMIAGIAMNTAEALQATFYYLIHSTWITAVLFLLTEVIAQQRGSMADSIVRGPQIRQHSLLASYFFVAAIAVVGMPPLSGFFGKILLLKATPAGPAQVWLWSVILVGSLATIVALGRTGSTLFWRVTEYKDSKPKVARSSWWSMNSLMALTIALVVFAQPVLTYLGDMSAQLINPTQYFHAVLSTEVVSK